MPRKSSAANAPKRSDSNVRRTIGANIRARRLTLGWSQQDLAERFGVSRAAVSQYEIGTGEVNAGDLPRLAETLGIGLLDFFGDPPPVSPMPTQKRDEKERDETTQPVSITPDRRQIELYDKADGLYVSDADNHVYGSLGKVVAPADKEAVLPLLRSILDLNPVNRETVRRVVQAMLGVASPDSGQQKPNKKTGQA